MLYVWRPYAIYYHLKRKQFMRFHTHNMKWAPLCNNISVQPVIDVIMFCMYSKEL